MIIPAICQRLSAEPVRSTHRRALRIVFAMMIGGCAIPLFATDGPPPALLQLWADAEKNSPGLKARKREMESIYQSIKSLPKFYQPTIYADAGYGAAVNKNGSAHGPLARIAAEWTLWDGGRRHFASQHNAHRARAAEFEQAVIAMGIKKAIAESYYQVAALADARMFYTEQIKQLARLAALAQPRLRIGKIGQSDIEEIRIRMAELKSRLAASETLIGLLQRQIQLYADSGRVSITAIPSLSRIRLLPVAAERGISFERLPVYRAALSRIKSLETQLDMERRSLYWPVLGVETYGGYGPYQDALDSKRPEIGIGVKLRFPLFASADRAAQLAAKRAEIEAMKLDIQQQLIAARMDYELKQGKINSGILRLRNIESMRVRASRNVAVSYGEFSRGLKSLADMLGTIQTLAESQNNYIGQKLELANLQAEMYLLMQASPPGEKTPEKK